MLKESLQDTWNFFRLHFIALSLIILPIVIPVDILIAFYQHLVQGSENNSVYILPVALKLAVEPFYSVGVIFYIAYIIKGERIDTKTAWLLGMQYWVPYFILTVLVSVVAMAGLMMLIIPGLVFLVRFSFAEFDLLLKNTKPVDAMKTSWILTRNYMTELFAGFALITLVLFGPYFLMLSFFDGPSMGFWIFDLATTIIYSVLQVLYTIFAFRIYDGAGEEKNNVYDLNER